MFQAKDLKDECENLTQQMDEFRKMTDTFISLTDQVFNKGGTGLSPTRARARPSSFFEVFRVPEPEVFETGQARLGPSPRVKPAGTRGYPKVMFYKTL